MNFLVILFQSYCLYHPELFYSAKYTLDLKSTIALEKLPKLFSEYKLKETNLYWMCYPLNCLCLASVTMKEYHNIMFCKYNICTDETCLIIANTKQVYLLCLHQWAHLYGGANSRTMGVGFTTNPSAPLVSADPFLSSDLHFTTSRGLHRKS